MRAMAAASRYNNLMSKYDKDLIARIQISQLISDDPYRDDFYYQVYTAIRARHGMPPTGGTLLNPVGRPDAEMKNDGSNRRGRGRAGGGLQRMQQQVQRAVAMNQRRQQIKSTETALEGALGKVTSSSTRNPRVLLQVKPKISTEEQKEAPETAEASAAGLRPKVAGGIKPRSSGAHRQVLRSIENVYDAVLKLEQLRRDQPPVPLPDAPADVVDGFSRWNQEYATHVKDVWRELKVTSGSAYPHPFIAFISFAKGKRIIPRALRHSLPEQILMMMTIIVAHFETIDCVAQGVYGPTGAISASAQESVELFMNTIVPPAMAFVSEAPIRIVVGLLALFLDRNNIAWVARGKVGLAFLTMFLSRAEILKQGGGLLQGLAPPTEEELAHWDELCTRVFQSLKGHYAHVFPPAQANVDDVYVWQFLAAIAVGATLEQQHTLVTEVRERVLETVMIAKSGRLAPEKAAMKIANCNLFLQAIGLDASQVVV